MYFLFYPFSFIYYKFIEQIIIIFSCHCYRAKNCMKYNISGPKRNFGIVQVSISRSSIIMPQPTLVVD